jgi:hypothetical protein
LKVAPARMARPSPCLLGTGHEDHGPILLATGRQGKSDPVNMYSGMEISTSFPATRIAPSPPPFAGGWVWSTIQPWQCLDVRLTAIPIDVGLSKRIDWDLICSQSGDTQ